MPDKDKLERCVRKLKRKGYSKDEAYPICRAAINQSKGESDEQFDERIDRLIEELKGM